MARSLQLTLVLGLLLQVSCNVPSSNSGLLLGVNKGETDGETGLVKEHYQRAATDEEEDDDTPCREGSNMMERLFRRALEWLTKAFSGIGGRRGGGSGAGEGGGVPPRPDDAEELEPDQQKRAADWEK